MGLYGAISASVSGILAESSYLSTIADNIANANTDGYKRVDTSFETLVTNAGSTSLYSPGGVIPITHNLVDVAGSIKTTGLKTDIAVGGTSKNGMFVVNSKADGTGDVLYTRAGRFRADNLGNIRNTAGHYLMAWPLDSQGLLPGQIGNANTVSSTLQSSLEVVNIQDIAGRSSATTKVELLKTNLNSNQAPQEGAGTILSLLSTSVPNKGLGATQIIIPDSGVTDAGDGIRITAGNTNFDFIYGGFDQSLDPTAMGTTGILGATTVNGVFSSMLNGVDGFEIQTASGTSTYTYSTASQPSAVTGEFNTLENLATAINTNSANSSLLTARVYNNTLYISPIDGTSSMTFSRIGPQFTVSNPVEVAEPLMGATSPSGVFTTGVAAGDGLTVEYLLQGQSNDISTTGNSAFGSSAAATAFSTGVLNGDGLQIATKNGIKAILTYTTGTPSASAGTFNSLSTLQAAIASTTGLSATLTGNTLSISASAAGDNVTGITNINTNPGSIPSNVATVLGLDSPRKNSQFFQFTGATTPVNGAGSYQFNSMNTLATAINAWNSGVASVNPVTGALTLAPGTGEKLTSIVDTNIVGSSSNFATQLGLRGVDMLGALGLNNVAAQSNRFSTLQGLAKLVNGSGQTGITSQIISPEQSAQLKINSQDPLGNISLMNLDKPSSLALGSTVTGNFLTEFQIATGPFGPSYDPGGLKAPNMASKRIQPHFTQAFGVYDALGTAHSFDISYLKLSTNVWGVEIYSTAGDKEIISDRTDGQVASGTLTFDGDGELLNITESLLDPVAISWKNGAVSSNITFDFGTAILNSSLGNSPVQNKGLHQLDGDFDSGVVDPDGLPLALLSDISVDGFGNIEAAFSNGLTQVIYNIPLALFANPNGLTPITGNLYQQSPDSGSYNLKQSGMGGAGTIIAEALEESNIELASELVTMIIVQAAHNAGIKVVQTADEMLTELNRAI